MSGINLKSHYTAQEIAFMRLPGLPGTRPGVSVRAKTEGWSSRPRSGQGGGYEYALDSMPSDIQNKIREYYYNTLLQQQPVKAPAVTKTTASSSQLLEIVRQCPAVLDQKTAELTQKQRDIADARMVLAVEVLRLEDTGLSRIKAINFICDRSRTCDLPEHLQKYVDLANARKGQRVGVSVRALNQWVIDYLRARNSSERLALLAPGHKKAKQPEQVAWVPMFMAHYRSPNGPTVAEAYKDFCAEWMHHYADQPAMRDAIPSIHAVYRVMDKMPKIVRQRGRVTGSAMTALQTYVKRDWSVMPVNGVWIGDGHSMKMKVAHPDHGRPFTPELTLVIDGRTRYVVGWSLALAENTLAVADALRHGIEHHGVPLLYYSDNGAGETGKLLDADITGILPRLGIEHPTGIPGNPQARGIIERLNKEIPARIARKFATYNGRSADKETARITSRAIDSAMNALNQNKALNAVQKSAIAKLPSWSQLIDAIEDEITAYNTQHRHSELPLRAAGGHYTPAEYRAELLADAEIDRLSEAELREMFRPQVKRIAQRGWLSIFNNQYFAEALIQVDGEEVLVAFDIHDASSVTVRRLDGSFVCTAIVNGNTRAAFPVDYIEKVRKDRHSRRMALVNKKAEEIDAELHPVRTIEQSPDFGALLQGDMAQLNDDREPLFLFESEREDYLRQKNKAV
ncbi:Mu transposase C-terminal domain-containing protein [Candidatus Symbiopectobacterium sp. NZEC135]|uniref:Mu transposase C-terminal domain-containing protein n=1 Tax=Candidatus Symbiopectobacterium sp. NZEC135 TaxID=2820471 RepID=UPI002225C37F|nr:Mu transposase C-terminal domain-containing protein [Candidatus Symbiopectobacterium sp. NZEC135]MCW2480519.1 transposase [Candidatus Symbiopectobacterium sp. NZEC135]